MPWFYCDACGDSVKKPKIPQHLQTCGGWKYTCIDCSQTFDGDRCFAGQDVVKHNFAVPAV